MKEEDNVRLFELAEGEQMDVEETREHLKKGLTNMLDNLKEYVGDINAVVIVGGKIKENGETIDAVNITMAGTNESIVKMLQRAIHNYPVIGPLVASADAMVQSDRIMYIEQMQQAARGGDMMDRLIAAADKKIIN